MKIFHLVPSLAPQTGGLAKAVASIASVQAGAGHTVWICAAGKAEHEDEVRQAFDWMPGYDQIQHLRVPSVWHRVRPENLLGGTQPDVLHIHGLWEPMLASAHLWAARNKVPVVLTPHGMSSPWQDRNYIPIKAALRRCPGWGLSWRKALRVHVLTEPEETCWRGRGFTSLHRVPNALFASECEVDPSGSRDPFTWLYLARFDTLKAPDLLIDAFCRVARDCPELRLQLAGPINAFAQGLQKQLEQQGLTDRVRFPGLLGPEARKQALEGSGCLVHPSHSEGFSLSLLEAWGAGCPILVSTAACPPDMATSSAVKTFDGTTEDLARKMKSLYETYADQPPPRQPDRTEGPATWEEVLPDLMALYPSTDNG